MTYFGLLLIALAILGVSLDYAEHRRVTRTGIRPRIEGPFN